MYPDGTQVFDSQYINHSEPVFLDCVKNQLVPLPLLLLLHQMYLDGMQAFDCEQKTALCPGLPG